MNFVLKHSEQFIYFASVLHLKKCPKYIISYFETDPVTTIAFVAVILHGSFKAVVSINVTK